MTEEELIRAQQELFAASRQTYQESLQPAPEQPAAEGEEGSKPEAEEPPAAAGSMGGGVAMGLSATLQGMDDEDDDYDDL